MKRKWTASNTEHNKLIVGLKAQVESYRKDNESFEEEIKDLNKKIQGLEAVNDMEHSHCKFLENQVKDCLEKLTAEEAKNVELGEHYRKNVVKLNEALAEKNNQIAKLEKTLNTLGNCFFCLLGLYIVIGSMAIIMLCLR